MLAHKTNRMSAHYFFHLLGEYSQMVYITTYHDYMGYIHPWAKHSVKNGEDAEVYDITEIFWLFKKKC